MRENILFITGHLAEPALRRVVEQLASTVPFDFEIRNIGVSVAALLHVGLVQRRLIKTFSASCRGWLQKLIGKTGSRLT